MLLLRHARFCPFLHPFDLRRHSDPERGHYSNYVLGLRVLTLPLGVSCGADTLQLLHNVV